ncbi:MAG: hypothetical protein BJ554DRAFT_6098 [Olpidium bornovanus]|uniref:Uncharacterized protein n=1 Tax=Olpidium bornovanus TaxID=278681 RepID=A0A8H7ZYB5_9FUNG|nr:MAG: hypothetical protein BJ554DRAFT_6098 [Olpidium bornovanus]
MPLLQPRLGHGCGKRAGVESHSPLLSLLRPAPGREPAEAEPTHAKTGAPQEPAGRLKPARGICQNLAAGMEYPVDAAVLLKEPISLWTRDHAPVSPSKWV